MAPHEDPAARRHLSAILYADMMEYSTVAARSESLSKRCVEAIRQAYAEVVPEHGGWFHPKAGDAVLALFPSAVGAVLSAMEIQRRLAKVREESRDLPLWLRIGAHIGEVTGSGDEWRGASIGAAELIQAEADPGGLKISSEVYGAIRNKVDLTIEDQGIHELGGVGSFHLYKVVVGTERVPSRATEDPRTGRRLRAILYAYLDDYPGIIARDEGLSLRCADAIRDAFATVVPRHGGWFRAKPGEAALALFPSAVEAVRSAVEVQQRLAEVRGKTGLPLWLRIGAHMGEVAPAGDDWQGDSINTTARIHREADPGGLEISAEVHGAVVNATKITVEDQGFKDLKGVGSFHLFKVVIGTERRERPSWMERVVLHRRELVGGVVTIAVAYVLGPDLVRRIRGFIDQSREKPKLPPLPADMGWPLAIGIMEILPIRETPGWMCDMTHQGLNALLAKLENLNVFSKDVIDWKKEKTGKKSFDVANDLGVRKMLNGTLLQENGRVTLQVRIVDVGTGRQENACDASGTDDQLRAFEHDVALHAVTLLKVPVSDAELVRLASKPKTVDLDAAKRFNDALGGDEEEAKPRPPKSAPGARLLEWPPAAYAGGTDDDAIKQLLDRYRAALQAKDLRQLAAIYVSLSDNTRDALQRYFDSANDLNVQFSNVTVLFEGDEALATFTRNDKFKDKETGRDVNLEVRVSTVVAKADGAWKIKALRKPS